VTTNKFKAEDFVGLPDGSAAPAASAPSFGSKDHYEGIIGE
jgi:hypothetical protein